MPTTDLAGNPAPLSSLGLATPSAAPRLRAFLHRAEQRLVSDAVRDGGLGPWRERIDRRLLVAREVLGSGRLSRAETAAFVLALTDVPLRDRCWARVEVDRGAGWLPLWRHLVRHALPPYRAEVLFLFAWTSWRQGDEPSARAAIEVLLAEEPTHRAGHLLAVLLRSGVSSDRVRPLVGPHEATRAAP